MKILTVTCENRDEIAEDIALGCDEIIVALEKGCFTSMHGFSLEEITSIAKENPKRTVVLMNRLFGEEETAWAKQCLQQLLNAVDGLMFADPGLMKTAEACHQENKMIYRPETLLTSANDAAWWMKQGLQSVVISPLLTEEEICTIAQNVAHTCLQIHGRLLMSVSKRKLLDAYAKVNGLADLQEKKDLYLREDSREGRMPIYENAYGTMIYTDYIQESFAYMPSFLQAGIERFEIDTNGLARQAVQDAIVIYRSILDGTENDGRAYLEKYQSLPLSTGYYGQKTIK